MSGGQKQRRYTNIRILSATHKILQGFQRQVKEIIGKKPSYDALIRFLILAKFDFDSFTMHSVLEQEEDQDVD